MNLREKILAADDIASETVHVKEWDVDVLVKGMSAGERITLMQAAFDQTTQQVNMSIVFPDVVVKCAYDPKTDMPIFSEADKAAILGKGSAPVETLANAGLRLSGIGKAEQDDSGKDSSSPESEDSSSN